jgi:hypothetical protein
VKHHKRIDRVAITAVAAVVAVLSLTRTAAAYDTPSRLNDVAHV